MSTQESKVVQLDQAIAGIQFGQVLKDAEGADAVNARLLTAVQIQALAAQTDFASLRSELQKLAESTKRKLTLAMAVVDALDASLPKDKDEGLKPKMRRGRLIEEIEAAAKDMKPFVLDSKEIDEIQERVAQWYLSSRFVRQVCLLLDPATKE